MAKQKQKYDYNPYEKIRKRVPPPGHVMDKLKYNRSNQQDRNIIDQELEHDKECEENEHI